MRFNKYRAWVFGIIILILLGACAGGGDEAVEDASDADTGAVDGADDSEIQEDDDLSATGSEEDSGGLPPTPVTGSKVEITRGSTNVIAASETAAATPTPPPNRTGTDSSQLNEPLDVILLLDATGSMANEWAFLKANLAAIGTELDTLLPGDTLRFGFVAYRDGAKTNPAQAFGLTDDWSEFSANLTAVSAVGGGDYPEDVGSGLQQAVVEMAWRPGATKLIILLGDAPPHSDSVGGAKLTDALQLAAEQDITLFSIGSDGLNEQGAAIFQEMAQTRNGRFFFLSEEPEEVPYQASRIYPSAEINLVLVDILLEVLNEQRP